MQHRARLGLLVALGIALSGATAARAQSNADCLGCHEDPTLTAVRDGRRVSRQVDVKAFDRSVHAGVECISCHADLSGTDFPHKEKADPVACGGCHEEVAARYVQSLHGRKVAEGDKLAPRCWDCHGSHDILPHTDPNSRVTKFNIPYMCGSCHKEGTAVSRFYNIPQDSILTHYSESIHGEGLYQKGLTITAVCTDCHTAHFVLPHTDSRSSIARANVAKTCEQCHGRIEQVHVKVIRGALWEKTPNQVPVCVDCHQPHKVRRIFYAEGISDRDCLICHSRPDIATTHEGRKISLTVSGPELHDSIHRNVRCAQCHSGVTPGHARPCDTVATKVDCSTCHAEPVKQYQAGIHGQLAARGDPDAPRCTTCHGTHGVKAHLDPESPVFTRNVPQLCARCHGEGNPAQVRYKGDQKDIVANYLQSVHGKGLTESGLVVTAMCADCHTAHTELPAADPASSVNPANIPHTCAKCHTGIGEIFARSIHARGKPKDGTPLPVCSDCHTSHAIARTDADAFKLEIVGECGKCHAAVTASYFETYHGKVVKLGSAKTAKCYDCHGSHDILPPSDPASHLSRQNVVATCAKCHPGSHRRFAGYLTHATHHDRAKYPVLYWTFRFMSSLLLGTFLFFGVHTLLWLPRSFQAMKHAKALRQRSEGQKQIRRFPRLSRQLHVLVVTSFLGLALTGMTLKFSYLGWAQTLARLLGGFEGAGTIHRICAVITFFYFARHIIDLVERKRAGRISWREFLTGPNSMTPGATDLKEFTQTMRWFVGLGPRPRYGRWTYWEKFDYFAVFWGVAMIGTTGLMLWFPEAFTRVLPGWFINVATIIHSDEALLATGFIFTIHFFNTHFRPDKFPMDTVIFSGRIPLEELKEDRPREYERLVESGELEQQLVDPLPAYVLRGLKVFGWFALSLGIALIVLIIWAEIFKYR
ncbi:MAG: hypothetical protein ACYDIE_12295 [Candidatus Krumholzibacteriia bacterium]